MDRKFYKECRRKGLSEEEIRRIDNLFVADRVRLYHENKLMEALGITVANFSALEEIPGAMDKVMAVAAADSLSPEEQVISNDRTRIIREALQILTEDEKELLRVIYDEMDENVTAAAKKLGIVRETARDRHKSILKRLKKFFEKSGYTFADFF